MQCKIERAKKGIRLQFGDVSRSKSSHGHSRRFVVARLGADQSGNTLDGIAREVVHLCFCHSSSRHCHLGKFPAWRGERATACQLHPSLAALHLSCGSRDPEAFQAAG